METVDFAHFITNSPDRSKTTIDLTDLGAVNVSARRVPLEVQYSADAGFMYHAGSFVLGPDSLSQVQDESGTQQLKGVLNAVYSLDATDGVLGSLETALSVVAVDRPGSSSTEIMVKTMSHGEDRAKNTALLPVIEQGQVIYPYKLSESSTVLITYEPTRQTVSVAYAGNCEATLAVPTEGAAGFFENSDWVIPAEALSDPAYYYSDLLKAADATQILPAYVPPEAETTLTMPKVNHMSQETGDDWFTMPIDGGVPSLLSPEGVIMGSEVLVEAVPSASSETTLAASRGHNVNAEFHGEQSLSGVSILDGSGHMRSRAASVPNPRTSQESWSPIEDSEQTPVDNIGNIAREGLMRPKPGNGTHRGSRKPSALKSIADAARSTRDAIRGVSRGTNLLLTTMLLGAVMFGGDRGGRRTSIVRRMKK